MERAASRGVEASLESATADPILVASYGDLKKARALGRTRIALMEHGYGQSFSNDNPSYAGGTGREAVELFLVPNEHAAQRNRERNPNAKVVIVGCPKLDDLPCREGKPNGTVAISFHFNAHVSPEATTAMPYYRKVLGALSYAYPGLIGHAHPRYQLSADRHYRKHGIPLVTDFADVCRQADVYVCDYSSTIYEFASTGRPVVVLNSPAYRRHKNHGLRFWEAANVGFQVNTPEELVPTVALALTDPPEQQVLREQALALVYQPRTNGAAYAATALREWLA